MKNNEEESKIMQLWHNKRTHAVMVLGLWMIFLLFVMVIAFISGETTKTTPLPSETLKEEEKVVFKDYKEMQNDILTNDYSYEYNITVGDYKVNYKGTKKGDVEEGYRENAEETIKYQIDATGLYKVLMDELHAYDKLFVNVNESFIDLKYIFELINNQSVTSEELEKTKVYSYSFILDEITYEMKVTTNTENIKEINIKFDDNEYKLMYNVLNEKNTNNQEEVN